MAVRLSHELRDMCAGSEAVSRHALASVGYTNTIPRCTPEGPRCGRQRRSIQAPRQSLVNVPTCDHAGVAVDHRKDSSSGQLGDVVAARLGNARVHSSRCRSTASLSADVGLRLRAQKRRLAQPSEAHLLLIITRYYQRTSSS